MERDEVLPFLTQVNRIYWLAQAHIDLYKYWWLSSFLSSSLLLGSDDV